MHSKSSLIPLVAIGALLLATPSFAQRDHSAAAPKADAPTKNGQLIRVTEKESAWAAKERAKYPLDVCVSSGAKLGSMGKAPEYIYRVEGKADRLVVFCCGGCDEDFLQAPAAHLAKIDAAKAKPKANSDARPERKDH